jgi:hypothetical protein
MGFVGDGVGDVALRQASLLFASLMCVLATGVVGCCASSSLQVSRLPISPLSGVCFLFSICVRLIGCLVCVCR